MKIVVKNGNSNKVIDIIILTDEFIEKQMLTADSLAISPEKYIYDLIIKDLNDKIDINIDSIVLDFS